MKNYLPPRSEKRNLTDKIIQNKFSYSNLKKIKKKNPIKGAKSNNVLPQNILNKNNNANNPEAHKNSVIIKNESSYLVLKSFLKEHQVKNPSIFILYLSEIWRDLSLYSQDPSDGIISFAFSRFFPLPGLINKRLFNVLDRNKDGYLSPNEFIEGLSTIYCEEICSLIKFIFLFYDFDYDGYITSEDIHAIMSYIPVIHSFNDMIDIEEEIQSTLNTIFDDKINKINLYEFIDLIINREVYEIFIPIVSFFFEQKPFTNPQIEFFRKSCIPYEESLTDIYKINHRIKLKITKKEEEKNDSDKNNKSNIVFDFDKNKFKDTIIENDTSSLDKKESPNINIAKNNKIENEKDIKPRHVLTKKFERNHETTRRANKSLSIKSIIIENNKINQFNKKYDVQEKEADKVDEIAQNLNNINNEVNNLNGKVNKKKITRMPKTISSKRMKDLVSDSIGFRRLQNSIPSLINKTKILAKYSSNHLEIYKEKGGGLSNFKKKNIIQDLCQSKIKPEKNEDERKITENSYEIERDENNNFVGLKLVGNNHESHTSMNIDGQNKDITYESYLYKITTNQKILKKLYFKLFNKDLYYFKTSESRTYKGMHNLSHYFLELSLDYNKGMNRINSSDKSFSDIITFEEDESYIDSASSATPAPKSNTEEEEEKKTEAPSLTKIINSVKYFCFILINQNGRAQWYLTPDKVIYNKWIEKLKQIMNYKNIFDKYILKEVAGRGKFSRVYRAIDKTNDRTVAIKIINKRALKLNELDLIKTEIDILKICQHPYVIGLYEVIETYNRIDIVLEYCKISNLYNYLQNKHFDLPELQIATYIHKIAKAVYSMHNLGIIHRDLKLSNIALVSEKDDIRILDFGLSKILGPGETCTESYGTPGYAAPEVINEEHYGFKADVWSIGAITYFMCTSNLPFDYETKGLKVNNIVVNTITDTIKFKDDCWKRFSKEVVKFIKECMNKNVEKRLTIKEVLEHEWIKKFFYNEVKRRKSFDINNNNINDKDNKSCFSRQRLEKIPRRRESNGAYRLYADISSDEDKI